ncbi:MAG TPA: M20/M25/M40 family metallo-hydrolase [Candidatus Dormibacteraeota bacterium]
MTDSTTAEATALLQQLIRNACVNDGTPESGQEVRNVDVLRDLLTLPGVELQAFEPLPGRSSLVARIEGSDPAAPALLLVGHTDVVPANPDGWQRDPHGGELVDGVVWGRGAVDMLNLTTTMALATRNLAHSGWRPRGTLVYLAVADEEAGGGHGAEWLLDNAAGAVHADYVVTESGGIPVPTPAGPRLWITVGEKGICWTRLTFHGTPGHGSRPLLTDNALVKAAEAVRRLSEYRPAAQISEVWRRWVDGMAFDADMAAALVDPARIWEAIDRLPLFMARLVHANTHTTVAPTVAHGGTKTNVIPDRVVLELDIRLLPGQSSDDMRRIVADALGELAAGVDIEVLHTAQATVSPLDTPLWDALEAAARRLDPEARCMPSLTTGGTDARFFRDRGIPAYGFGLFSRQMSLQQYSTMFHGNDERIDQESLRLSVELWEAVARNLLG